MPRYIDADSLVRRLKHSPLFLGTHMQFKDGVVDLVERQPTADVVPKSEVAKEFTCFVGDPHKVEHCPYLEEVEKVRSEVAREIFEEIRKFSKKPIPEAKAVYILSEGDLQQLKKKYTEGE